MERTTAGRIGDGLVAGLGWGLGVAVADGLSLLWQGAPWPHLGERLLALAYLAAIYGLIGGLLGATLAALFSLVTRLFPRRPTASNPQSRPEGVPNPDRRESPIPNTVAFLAALTVIMPLAQRFQPRPVAWAVIALLAVGAGLAVGRLARAVGRASVPGWAARAARIGAAGLFALALLAVAGAAGYRALAAGSVARAAGIGAAAPAPDRPNIVLITAGGLRADHLGAYGYDPAVSPNLDALAARGVRFERAVAPGSWGRPSAAALVTSIYPGALGYHRDAEGSLSPAPDPMRTTLAETLRAAGYRTGAVLAGPWLNAPGFAQGFDTFDAARDQEPFDDAPMRGRMLGRLFGCRKGSAACRLYRQGRGLLFDARLIANAGGDAVNAGAARFLDRYGAQPFFLWVYYDDALPPYNLADPARPLAEGPLASPARRLKNLGYWELGDPLTAREELLPDDAPGLVALYDGEAQRVDRLAGELLAMLDARGLASRTLVVVLADHGQELGDHGGYTYGHTLYDEVVRVPLIVAGPGVTAGRAIETPVSLIDVAPTLAALAGATLPAEAQGQSLAPALRGQAIDERPVFSEALYRVPYNAYAVLSGGYKLIYYQGDPRVALYDLRADPAERRDVAGELPDVAATLRAELARWQARMRDLELTGLPRSRSADPDAGKLW